MAQTSVSIPEDLLKKSQHLIPNLSGLVQNAIKKQLNIKEVEVRDKCDFCHKEGIMETAAQVNEKRPNALTFLCPDEKWVCNSCLGKMSAHVLN